MHARISLLAKRRGGVAVEAMLAHGRLGRACACVLLIGFFLFANRQSKTVFAQP